MSVESRSQWICVQCHSRERKGGDNSDTPVRNNKGLASPQLEFVTQRTKTRSGNSCSCLSASNIRDIIREELQSMFASKIQPEIVELRNIVSSIELSMAHFNGELERVKSVQDEQSKAIQLFKSEIESLATSNKVLSSRLAQIDQHARSSNIEIHCVPENKQENLITTVLQLGKVVKCPISEAQIHYCSRLAKMNNSSPRPRSILVKFSSPRLRDEFLAATTKFNRSNRDEKLNSSHLGIGGNKKTAIYVAEHLTHENKSLHAAARARARELGYKYVWGTLSCYYQNVRGLNTKTIELFGNVVCCNFDVIVFTETWLNSGVSDNELFDDRYMVYRRDRESSDFHGNKMGGGVLIAVSKRFHSSRVLTCESKCEDLWVKIELFDRNHQIDYLYICAVYIPPPVQKHILDHFVLNTSSVIEKLNTSNLVVLGDFNLGGLFWDGKAGSALTPMATNSMLNNIIVDFMSLNALSQYNYCLNNKNRTLDLVMSSLVVSHLSESEDPLSRIDPLHPPIELTIGINFQERLESCVGTRFRFHKADYERITFDLSNISWDKELSSYDCVDDMVEHFYKILREVIAKHVPKSKPRTNKYPLWFSGALVKVINEKFKYRTKYRKYGNPRDLITFELLRERCTKLHNLNYRSYLDSLETTLSSNPKIFWSYIKYKKGRRSSSYPASMSLDNRVASSGPDICNLFALQFSSVFNTNEFPVPDTMELPSASTYLAMVSVTTDEVFRVLKRLDPTKSAGSDGIPSIFVVKSAKALALPLQIIFNKSLCSGVFPSAWKNALVMPLFKGGDRCVVQNYRPISILTTFGKIFESILYPILACQFKQYVVAEQHGFVKSRSTSTNLFSFVEDLAEGVDHGHSYDAIYTDFSKAFDKVSHGLLLHKLSSIGVTGAFLSLCRSYLLNRYSKVVVGGHASREFVAASGVPQGSLLGPLFFNIFINDIEKCFHGSKFLMFADDLKLYRLVDTPQDSRLLQRDLSDLVAWCDVNGMGLNPSKCHVIRFSRKKATLTRTYYINHIPLDELDHTRDLGVIVDSKLRFNLHIEDVVGRAFRMLGFVLRNCKEFKSPRTKITLYNCLVRSLLEYCSVVWNPHYNVHINRLESVQKRFLRHLSYNYNMTGTLLSYSDRLIHFNMKSLRHRRELFDIMFLYKLVNGNLDTPNILSKINFTVPKIPQRLRKPPFKINSAKSNLGKFSPLNRSLRSYNMVHNLATDSNRIVDIFSNCPKLFKLLTAELIGD
ncbi:unnamed protein product [Euphydryas editha]|uniref:Reverse transcriptase domain-containing protein n=1 Tax=Euphydryas editha TaxID=104508 RepID=A0AAU9UDC2_EUPED|nr:unnamed protein product [Euphydryas editha]